jgi:hypothetical protein
MVENNHEKSWQSEIEHKVPDSWAAAERHAQAPAHPINPQEIVWARGCLTMRS